MDGHPIEDIYKIIPKEELDSIVQKVNVPERRPYYFNAICSCIDELYDVKESTKVVKRFVNETQEGPEILSRSFIHLMIGYKLKRHGQLREIEASGDIDIVLANGLKAELTRLDDFEQIGEKRIRKEIKKIPHLSDLSLMFYIKTLDFNEVTRKIRSEFKKPPFKEHIENEAFDLVISSVENLVSMPVNVGINIITHISTGPKNNLGIQFKISNIKLIDLIVEKTKHEACKNSDILIVDLTNDFANRDKRYIDNEIRNLDEKLIPENIKLIVYIRFFWSGNIIKADIGYKSLSADKLVSDFIENFLQKDSIYETV